MKRLLQSVISRQRIAYFPVRPHPFYNVSIVRMSRTAQVCIDFPTTEEKQLRATVPTVFVRLACTAAHLALVRSLRVLR
jgi:hypothetical protein